jgi:hypothetical protein
MNKGKKEYIMKFKVGDKVKVVKVNHKIKNGYIGKEMVISSINPNIKNRATKSSENHYGFEKCVFVFYDSELAPVDNHKIVITTDGNKTLARLYEGNNVIKSAVAKCSPEDTFDFETGARIAFDRLVGEKPVEEKPKYYNGKVVCVESICRYLLTKGKIYSIIDGEFTFDEGCKVYEIKSFEDLSDRFESKFVELVE